MAVTLARGKVERGSHLTPLLRRELQARLKLEVEERLGTANWTMQMASRIARISWTSWLMHAGRMILLRDDPMTTMLGGVSNLLQRPAL